MQTIGVENGQLFTVVNTVEVHHSLGEVAHVGHVHFVYIRMNRAVSAHFSALPWLRM